MGSRKRMITLFACGSLVFAGCDNAPTTQPEATQPQPSAQAIDLNDMNFTAQTAQGVTLVDFWAPWCPPCRMQGPIVDDVAKRLGTAAKVAKVNVDEAPTTAETFGIRSIPTLIILKDGKQITQFVGLTQADELITAVKGAL